MIFPHSIILIIYKDNHKFHRTRAFESSGVGDSGETGPECKGLKILFVSKHKHIHHRIVLLHLSIILSSLKKKKKIINPFSPYPPNLKTGRKSSRQREREKELAVPLFHACRANARYDLLTAAPHIKTPFSSEILVDVVARVTTPIRGSIDSHSVSRPPR